jgi:SAM-dependent methyltransferase
VDIQSVRLFLKKNFDGEEVLEALRFRLRLHLQDPTQDPLSNQVWLGYQELPKIIKTPCSILDAGCMSGFLYHHLKKHITDYTYTGVDRWDAALQVAKEFAPEVEFVKGNLETDFFGYFDYVICSNIPWQVGDKNKAVENLLKQTRKELIFIHPGNVVERFERSTRNPPDA